MSTDVLERPVEDPVLTPENGIVHWVCHCTKDLVAGCGRYVGDLELGDDLDGEDCPECVEAWPEGMCPWGCTCPEECAADDDDHDDDHDHEFRGQRILYVILDEAAVYFAHVWP